MGPESDYKFITVDAVEGTVQPASKAVRSHAIRTAIQRGGSELGTATALISQGTIRGKAHLRGRFRLGGAAVKTKNPKNHRRKDATEPAVRHGHSLFSSSVETRTLAYLHCLPRLGSDSADPFNTLPIPSSPSVDVLVRYCKMDTVFQSSRGPGLLFLFAPVLTVFNLNSTTIDAKRPWFPYAMQSALIMRTTLALAAEFLVASTPSPDPSLQREGYLQKGEAMRMVRSRLESRESARRASNDLSVLAGHFAAADVHLTGLHAMITARGGPDTIKHDFILCRSINWIDIQVASGLARVPKFPMFHTLDQVSLPSSVVSRAATPSLRHLDRLAGDDDADEGEGPRRMFTTLRQAVCSQAGGVPADDIRIVMNTADSTILHFLYAERRTAATPVQKRLLVLASAAQVFLYAVLREIPTTGHMVRILVTRLRAALEDADADAVALVWVSHDAALLWVLFVGFAGSGMAEDRAWFAARLLEALERARDVVLPERRGRESLRRLLAGFLWRDKYCLPALDDAWALWERGVT
ncbi:hypothetical protein LZ30DRAFT_589415 [Colletotrichum cereale]|nr:hypothetical protein LZ30DRAFT_589415 [Colletotrichum cereale]